MKTHPKIFCAFLLLTALVSITDKAYSQTSTFKYIEGGQANSLIKILLVQSKTADNSKSFHYDLELNKQVISLEQGEAYIGNSNNIFYTNSPFTNTEGNTGYYLNSYTITKNSINKIKSIKLEDAGYDFFLNEDNSNILVSDEFEGLGYEVTLYNANLTKLAIYSPFADAGFKRSISTTLGQNTAFVFFPINTKFQPKLVLIDTRSGKVKFEKILNTDEADITTLSLIGDYVITGQHQNPSQQEMLCYDNIGNLVWRKLQPVYALEAFKTNQKWLAFAMDKNNYWFIDPANGVSGVKKSFTEIFSSGTLGKDIKIDISTNSASSKLNLLVSRKNEDQNSQYQYDLYAIGNPNERPLKIKTITSKDAFLYLTKLNSKILVNNSDNQIIYSYEN